MAMGAVVTITRVRVVVLSPLLGGAGSGCAQSHQAGGPMLD